MAGSNQFYPLGLASGANVLTPATWAASAARQSGFQSGIAPSNACNTAWRQASVIASMIGAFIAKEGYDALDDSDLEKLLTNYIAALGNVVSANLPTASALWHFGEDTSTSAGRIVANVAPNVPGYAEGTAYSVKVNNNAVGGGTLASLDGFADRPVHRPDGSAIQEGDWGRGQILVLIDDGQALQLVFVYHDTPATSLLHAGTGGGTVNTVVVSDLKPAITAYSDKLPFLLVFPNGVADAATIAVQKADGSYLPALPFQHGSGSAIKGADITPGAPYLAACSGTQAIRLVGLAPSEIVTPTPSPATQVHVGTVSGSPGALVVNDLNAPIAAYGDRYLYAFTFASVVNDGDSVSIKASNGTQLAAIPLLRNDGSAIKRADLPPFAPALFEGYGTNALRLFGFGYGEVQRVTVNPVLWAQLGGGSDANDGLSQSAPMTLDGALAKLTSVYNFGSGSGTIRLLPGTENRSGALVVPRGSGTINITGDAANPGNYVISGASAGSGNSLTLIQGACNLTGVTLRNTGTSAHTLALIAGGVCVLVNVPFVTTVGGNGNAHIFSGGSVTIAAGCSFTGNMASLAQASGGTGQVSLNTSTSVAVLGNPTFSLATVYTSNGGQFIFLSGSSFSGGASGPRYLAQTNSIINSNGGGLYAIPGSSDGSTSTGGQYVP